MTLHFSEFKIISYIALAFVFTIPGYGQKKEISNLFEVNNTFLHTSQDYYSSEDTIWYKAYIGYETSSSEKIYITSLLSNIGKPITEQKIKSEKQSVDGAIVIPSNTQSGSYYITFSSSSNSPYCSKKIVIVNKEETGLFLNSRSIKGRVHVDFFPEGGRILNGIPCKVAFKVSTTENHEIFNGSLVDQNNREITKISTYAYGMGIFVFKPDPGKKYYISFTTTGNITKIPLPPTEEKGYSIISNPLKESIKIIIQYSGPEYEEVSKKDIFLSVLSNGKEYVQIKGKLNDKSMITNFEKSKLNHGINEFRLIDNESNVLSTREVFIDKGERPHIKITKDKTIYSPGEKVKLTLSVIGQDERPLSSELSMGVSKGAAVTSIGLTDQIEVDPVKRDKILDLIMLTTPSITKNATTQLSSDYITVRGSIRNMKNDSPEANLLVHFLLPKQGEYYQTTTDSKGFFDISLFDFKGKKECYILPQISQTNEEIEVSIHDNYSFSIPDGVTFNVTDDLLKFVHDLNQASRIDSAFQNISNETKIIVEESLKQDYQYYQNPDHTFTLSEYEEFETMEETTKEILHALRTSKKNGKNTLKVISKESNMPMEGKPLLIIDGVPTFDPDIFFRIDPKKISYIDVLSSSKTLSQFGTLGNFGVVAVYKNDISQFSANPNTTKIVLFGLKEPLSFDAPEASRPKVINFISPVKSSLIYWNPNITIPTTGEKETEFTLSEESGEFEIRVQGITEKGDLIYGRERIQVQFKSTLNN